MPNAALTDEEIWGKQGKRRAEKGSPKSLKPVRFTESLIFSDSDVRCLLSCELRETQKVERQIHLSIGFDIIYTRHEENNQS